MSYVLRLYQREAVDAAVSFLKDPRKYNAIEVLPTGSGKSLIIACVVKELGEPVLIFQPSKEILEQNLSKLHAYGYDAAVYSASKGRKEIANITLATIGSVTGKTDLFGNFRYVIVDECFPAGSIVDGRPIETIRVGDTVQSFNHETNIVESKHVVRLFKRPISGDLIVARLIDGSSFCCTDNHPIYVKNRGYIPAYMLSFLGVNEVSKRSTNEPKENLFLQGMWQRVPAQEPQQDKHLLQQGVCIGTKSAKGKNSLFSLWQRHCYNGILPDQFYENWKGLLSFWLWFSSSKRSTCDGSKETKRPGMENEGIGAHEKEESNVDSRNKRENDSIYEGQEACCQGGEWANYKAARDTSESHRVGNRVSRNNYSRESYLSFCASFLQSRLSRSKREVGRRGGRQEPQTSIPEVARLKEDGSIEFLGVDSVEVHKRGSGQQFERLCPDNYVYNIEVEDNHNYFVNNTLVHNCHKVNSKKGMYQTFVKALSEAGAKVLGLTATPYRLASNSFGSELRFLTRTRPRIFQEMIYLVQNRRLFREGYLARLEYSTMNGYDRSKLKMNSTGADFTDESVQTCCWASNLPDKIVQVVNREMASRKNVLVFTRFVEEAQYLVHKIPGSAIVTGETPKKERERLINGFKRGTIPVVCNCGVLTTGFDYPELETIIIARPTMSLALYYQMIGRSARPHPLKESAKVIDMCGNFETFGRVEDLEIRDEGNGKWIVASGEKQLTNVYQGRPA